MSAGSCRREPGAQSSSRAKPSASTARSTRRAQSRIEPASVLAHIAPDRSRAARSAPCRAPRSPARKRSIVRPRRFRVDVIGRHRRDAAPVVDAGRDQIGRSARAADWAAPGCSSPARTQPRHRDRSTAVVERPAPARCAMPVPGLARKFWTMISWIWPCASMQRRAAPAATRCAPRASRRCRSGCRW